MWTSSPSWCRHRLKQRQLNDLLALTESCTWSTMPARDPGSGSLTMAGRIPLIQKFTWQSIVLIMVSHAVHQTHRLATRNDRPLVFNAWFPFDTTKSPVYELVYLAQVSAQKESEILVTTVDLQLRTSNWIFNHTLARCSMTPSKVHQLCTHNRIQSWTKYRYNIMLH